MVLYRSPNQLIQRHRLDMTYRQISIIAKCSSGAVSAEIRKMKEEGKLGNVVKCPEMKIQEKQMPTEQKIELEITRY